MSHSVTAPNPLDIDRGYSPNYRSYWSSWDEDYSGEDLVDSFPSYSDNNFQRMDPSFRCSGHNHYSSPHHHFLHTNYHTAHYTTIATRGRVIYPVYSGDPPAYAPGGSDWYLYRNGSYRIMGGVSTQAIVTNHVGISTLTFASAGIVNVTPTDTVNVDASAGNVTLGNDTTWYGTPIPISGGGASPYYAGWVNAVDPTGGHADNFYIEGNGLTLDAKAGNDKITVHGSRNWTYGGDGDDEIVQTSNFDSSYPDSPHSDNDITTNGGAYSGHSNYIYGGAGKDKITVPSHNAWKVDGGDDSDTITVANWNSDVNGGGGNDKIEANDCNKIHGGNGQGSQADGADTIHAHNGNSIWGDDGVDSIVANNGNSIWGNRDGDSIWGNDYNFISGGGLADTIFASEYNTVLGGVNQNISDSDDGGYDVGTQGDGADSITVEIGNKVYGGGGNDSIYGQYANLIYGNAGDDSIVALDKDSISGGEGADCIKAGKHAYVDAGPTQAAPILLM